MEKNRTEKIFLICFLSILAIGLLVFMSICLVNRSRNFFYFSGKTNMEILEQKEFDSSLVEKITVNVKSSDVHIVESNTNQIEVKISGNKKEEYQVELVHGELRIAKKGGNYFCIGFCYTDYEIEIKLPQSYQKDINIKTASGGIEIDSNLTSDLKISTISGDIEIKEIGNASIKTTSGDIDILKANDLKLVSTSGDIEIDSCKNIDIVTTSGDISIDLLELSKNGKIKTVSGDIEIERTNGIYVETKTVSGDTQIRNNNRTSQYELFIETTSGDIEVE